MEKLVTCVISDQIALLTLNRPEKLNAINYAMADRLLALRDQLETDESVGAIILTGAGEKAFSAGGDIWEFSASVRQGPDVAVREFVKRGQAMTARIEFFPKPIIAAVNGLAFGGGCEIVEAVHLAVASDKAVFAKPEIKLGMPPTFGGTQRLARVAGRKRVLEHLLTGEPFSPAKALEMGLVNRVVPHDELLPAGRAHDGAPINVVIAWNDENVLQGAASHCRHFPNPYHRGLILFGRALECDITPDEHRADGAELSDSGADVLHQPGPVRAVGIKVRI